MSALCQNQLRRLLAAWAALWLGGALAGLAAESPVLTNALSIRSLSQEAAAARLPARLTGVLMGEAEPAGAHMLWDGTSSIYLLGHPDHFNGTRRGDRIEVTGVTDPGGFAPCLGVSSVRVVGQGTLPEPRVLTADELFSGLLDGEWVELSGVVRSAQPAWWTDDKTMLVLAAAGQRLTVQVNRRLTAAECVDARIRLRGFCFYRSNKSRQALTPLLLVPKDEPVRFESPPVEPFSAPLQPVAALFQFTPGADLARRVQVRGTVLHARQGESLWIRDGERGLHVKTGQTNTHAVPGHQVFVTGFPLRGGYTPILEDAVFKVAGQTSAPPARPIARLSEALLHDADLVAFEAHLADLRPAQDGWALGLEWDGRVVRAHVRLPSQFPLPDDWKTGSRVRVSGICTVTSDRAGEGSGVLEPDSFQLLLRSVFDLVVVEPPPWWTPQRVIRLLGAVAVVLALGVGLVFVAARLRLREQAARRATAEAEFAAMLAERSRIAREIHDTLAQGLGAISMHLELVKDQLGDAPADAARHLGIAHEVARSSLADARRSIWNMRSQSLEKDSLSGALRKVVAQVGRDLPAEVRVEGVERRLPPVVENDLLRIGQEAVTNAVRHSRARRVDVHLRFTERAVRLSVVDDGQGFDPAHPPASEGGFGLLGMRERVAEMKGVFEFSSRPGQGTTITVEVALPAPDSGKPG